jgi:hypothetical protein
MAPHAIVDHSTSLLLKDNVQAGGQVKQQYAMLEPTIMTDPALVQEVGRRGQVPNHYLRPQS